MSLKLLLFAGYISRQTITLFPQNLVSLCFMKIKQKIQARTLHASFHSCAGPIYPAYLGQTLAYTFGHAVCGWSISHVGANLIFHGLPQSFNISARKIL